MTFTVRPNTSFFALVSLFLAPALVACGSDDSSGSAPQVREADVIANYADHGFQGYSDAVDGAVKLQSAIDDLVANPSQDNLDAARQAWRDSREPYQPTESYRFYEGPIDNAVDGPEGFINSWPLDEAFIDYVKDDEGAGIINHGNVAKYATIDADLLVEENVKDGEKDISTGYHAIEFLLWGQDFNVDGPGDRPFTDYVTDGTGTAKNQDRRITYLKTLADLLVKDLTQVRDAWDPDKDDNYDKTFRALPFKQALTKILTGMGALSGAELSGERMSVAYEDKDQEDEHSCFSDNTTRDLTLNSLGIQNVYLGKYGPNAKGGGPGIYDIVKQRDATLADKLKDQLQASQDAMDAIPQPFDQAILGDDSDSGRTKIHTAIQDLQTESDTVADVGKAFGITLNLEP